MVHALASRWRGTEPARPILPTPPSPSLLPVELLFAGGSDAAAAVATGSALAKGAIFTRYLVEAPPNVCTPT